MIYITFDFFLQIYPFKKGDLYKYINKYLIKSERYRIAEVYVNWKRKKKKGRKTREIIKKYKSVKNQKRKEVYQIKVAQKSVFIIIIILLFVSFSQQF